MAKYLGMNECQDITQKVEKCKSGLFSILILECQACKKLLLLHKQQVLDIV